MANIEFTALTGDITQEIRRLAQFDLKKQRRIMKAAFNSSLAPTKTALRRAIRREAVRFGFLSKAVMSKVKAYKDGAVVLLVGIRDRRVGQFQSRVTGRTYFINPGKYFHLVSGGTKPHRQPNGWRVTTQSGRQIWVKPEGGTTHPGAEPRRIRSEAARSIGPKTQERFIKQFERRFDKCLS